MAFIAESDRHQSGRGVSAACPTVLVPFARSDRQENGRGEWHQNGRGVGGACPPRAYAIRPRVSCRQDRLPYARGGQAPPTPLQRRSHSYAIWPSAQERNARANAICPQGQALPTPLQNTNVLAIALIQTELTE